MPQASIAALLESAPPDAPAIGAPGGVRSLSYRDLRTLVRQTVDTLNGLAIGRGDRVAIVLPNGPEMASAFIAVAAGAATAPLNPGYPAHDLEFYLGDLRPKALVLEAGADVPARAVARKMSIPVLELSADRARAPAGSPSPPRVPHLERHPAEGWARRTIRRSSSTPRGRPRARSSSRCSSEISWPAPSTSARTLALTRDDVCLNIMPLFHIHGLIAATLSSLAAGGAVCCTPGFNALRFFAWLDEVKPTWYTAVPTMHQAILARAERNRDILARSRLRLIRSSSASLPAPVMVEMEKTFGVPGHRELRHDRGAAPDGLQSRCPRGRASPARWAWQRARRWRSSTRTGRRCRAGEVGEVAIRGPNVTPGYEANPEANAKSFTRRLVPHRRPGRPRRGGLPPPHRPAQGADQPRRREDLPAGGGRRALVHPAVAAGAHLRHAARQARRGGGGGGRAARGRDGDRARAPRLLPRAGSPTSRCRGRWCSSRRSRRAPPASSSASAWPRSWASGRDVKICVFGAGAIGGLLAREAGRARAGRDVVVARAAPRGDPRARADAPGGRDRASRSPVRATDRWPSSGSQDLVIIGAQGPPGGRRGAGHPRRCWDRRPPW